MTVLPVVARELRVASRRSGTYWMRVSATGTALGFALIAFFTFTRGTPVDVMGGRMFLLLGWAGMVFALVVGIGATADTISKEKREGTLGLLFLTDLKGFDVVLGKMAASSLTVVYALMAMLPVLALTLLMGGVSFDAYLRVALTWLNGLFLALSVGMMVSALSRDDRVAFGNSYAALLGLAVMVPLIGLILQERFGNHDWFLAFYMVSPLTTLHFALAPNLSSQALGFWVSLVVTHLLAWIALGVACRVTKRAWHDAAPAKRPKRWPWPWRKSARLSEGGAFPTRTIQGRSNLMINPIFWLLTRERWLRTYPWILLASIVLIWAWALTLSRNVLGLEASVGLGFLAHFLFKYWITTQAVHSFSRDRLGSALELILSTPIGVRQILSGVSIAMRHLFAAPLGVLLVAELLLVFVGLFQIYDRQPVPVLVFTILSGLVLMVADAWALTWVGVLAGLRARQAQIAVYRTLALVLLLPCLAVWGLLVLIGFGNGHTPHELPTVAWVIFSVAADLFFGLRARARLHRHFREIAVAGPALRREAGPG
jgi:ABC-type transport system involved in multi-copper enzyme maturation permease subunit